jgi:hypothetical protein
MSSLRHRDVEKTCMKKKLAPEELTCNDIFPQAFNYDHCAYGAVAAVASVPSARSRVWLRYHMQCVDFRPSVGRDRALEAR